MSHMHSAQDIFEFLQQVQSTISEADFDILLAELSTRDYIPDKQEPTQFTVSIAHEIPQPLIAELREVLTTAMQKPSFHSKLTRLADGYDLLEKVASVLRRQDLIAGFIKAMRIDDSNATHQEVMASINAFVDTLEPPLKEKLHAMLDIKRCESNIALTYPQLVEAHNIIQDETVYQKFVNLLEECAMDDSSWPQIIARIYELIQSQKPDVWEKLGLLLDRVSRSDDQTTYSNYEEYVKRNFLESGDREELDADIDRAQMEHTLGL
ncbi:unnamed protein product [Umbelopsis vinacea]